MSNPNRVSPGVPTGGQYATQGHAETDIALSEDLFGEESPMPDVDYRPISSVHDGEDFSHATVEGTDLRQARARRANFGSADLRGADLTGIDASDADFSKADLTGADLTDGRFDGAVFHDADLTGQLDGTVFAGADLSAAVVGSADRASFRGSSLRGATLSGHFEGCDFRGADFSGAQMDHGYHKKANDNLSDVSFSDCRFDETPLEDSATAWPENFDVPRDAEFRRHGFTAGETVDWVEGGWDSGSAAAWKTSGLDPDVAKDLADNGIGPDTVAQYAAHGVTDPDEVGDWDEAHIAPERVAEWTDAGFTTGIQVPLPHAVREWGPTGLPAADCAAWSRAITCRGKRSKPPRSVTPPPVHRPRSTRGRSPGTRWFSGSPRAGTFPAARPRSLPAGRTTTPPPRSSTRSPVSRTAARLPVGHRTHPGHEHEHQGGPRYP